MQCVILDNVWMAVLTLHCPWCTWFAATSATEMGQRKDAGDFLKLDFQLHVEEVHRDPEYMSMLPHIEAEYRSRSEC